MNADQPELPMTVERGRCCMVQPFRDAVTRGEKEAQAALDAIQAVDDLGWFWEEITFSTADECGYSEETLRLEVRKMVRLRDGYDTWPSKRLEKIIRLMGEAIQRLTALRDAHLALRARELAEMQEAGVAPMISP